jgi:hypothetical protein
MGQVNWFDRKFDFSGNQNTMPTIVERLEGTPIRLRAKLSKIDERLLRVKPEGKWSILEHIGHLIDLEPLWQGRLDDILMGMDELRQTDLTNRRTTEANHNERNVKDLINDFERIRSITIDRLVGLSEHDVFKFALHPRLKTPMRTIDHFTFVAEHDDHHLAVISTLGGLRS